MKDFGYCIWAVPDNKHPWYRYTRGFTPHISIKTNFKNKDEALRELRKIRLNKPIQVKLRKDTKVSHVDGFYAVLRDVDVVDKPAPTWWPKDAHVSFAYKYEPFSDHEIQEITNQIEVDVAKISKIVLKRCIGHYQNWV